MRLWLARREKENGNSFTEWALTRSVARGRLIPGTHSHQRMRYACLRNSSLVPCLLFIVRIHDLCQVFCVTPLDLAPADPCRDTLYNNLVYLQTLDVNMLETLTD